MCKHMRVPLQPLGFFLKRFHITRGYPQIYYELWGQGCHCIPNPPCLHLPSSGVTGLHHRVRSKVFKLNFILPETRSFLPCTVLALSRENDTWTRRHKFTLASLLFIYHFIHSNQNKPRELVLRQTVQLP